MWSSYANTYLREGAEISRFSALRAPVPPKHGAEPVFSTPPSLAKVPIRHKEMSF